MTRVKALSKPVKAVAAFAMVASLSACLAMKEDNVHPVARVAVGALSVESGKTLVIQGMSGTIVLDGSTSYDPDGVLTDASWWNTGTPAATRFPAGSMLSAGATLAMPDVGKGLTASVTVPAGGTAVFSLYVTDDRGEVSAPATVRFTP